VVLTNYDRYGVLPGNNINSGPGFVTADGLEMVEKIRWRIPLSGLPEKAPQYGAPFFFPGPLTANTSWAAVPLLLPIEHPRLTGHMSDTADAPR
jgi:hypothetical protein